MKSGKRRQRVLALFFAFVFMAENVFAAEMQPIPPVTVPPVGATPPETLPPSTVIPSTLPNTLPNTMPMTPPLSLPETTNKSQVISSKQETLPSPRTSPSESTPFVMTAPESVPVVSQPLRPVSPQTIAETAKKVEEEGIYFNVADEDIREVVKQISRALGKNFLLDDKLRGKVTIISERKMTKDEVWEAFQSALDVIGFTIVQGPAGLLRVVPVREAISNPVDFYVNKSPFTDRFITRLITLKNISAADMANVIKGLVSREGNLFAYPVTNTLILTDSGTNIDRLMNLINELDKEGPQEVLEIIPIIYADAKGIAEKVTQIFETEKATTPAHNRGKVGAAEIEEVPRLRKVIPDDRTNSLIVLASKMAIKRVRDVIKKLDAPLAADEGEVHVYYLKHANAKDMTTVLNAIAGAIQQGKDKRGGPGAPPDAAKAAVSGLVGGAEFAGKFTVTAEESTNALVITAGSKDFNTLVDQVISKLDIPRRQVYVEAVIAELSITQDQQIGTSLLGGKTFNVGGNQLALFGSTFGFLDPKTLLNGPTVGGATSTTFNIPTPNTTGTAGTTSTTVPAFLSAINLSQSNTDINVLSTPNILTLDNQEAEIKVGSKVPFPSASATTIGGSLQTTFTREDVTLSLKIKPQIHEGSTVRLEVTQENREVAPNQPASAAQSGPTTTERSIKTAIVATDGQTIVLGGLIKDSYSNVIQKVPLLGDIPILGYLFKTKKKQKNKVNLIVFLTPHIIREPRDFLAILQRKINEQNAFITDNFGKVQQKQIQKSLETHASHLLQATEAAPPPETLTSPPMPSTPSTPPTPSSPPSSKVTPPLKKKESTHSTDKRPPKSGEDIDLAY